MRDGLGPVRQLLVQWGREAERMREAQGWPRQNVVVRLAEVAQTGVWSDSTLHLFADRSDRHWLSDEAAVVDRAVASLVMPQERAILNLWYTGTAALTGRERNRARAKLAKAELVMLRLGEQGVAQYLSDRRPPK